MSHPHSQSNCSKYANTCSRKYCSTLQAIKHNNSALAFSFTNFYHTRYTVYKHNYFVCMIIDNKFMAQLLLVFLVFQHDTTTSVSSSLEPPQPNPPYTTASNSSPSSSDLLAPPTPGGTFGAIGPPPRRNSLPVSTGNHFGNLYLTNTCTLTRINKPLQLTLYVYMCQIHVRTCTCILIILYMCMY